MARISTPKMNIVLDEIKPNGLNTLQTGRRLRGAEIELIRIIKAAARFLKMEVEGNNILEAKDEINELYDMYYYSILRTKQVTR